MKSKLPFLAAYGVGMALVCGILAWGKPLPMVGLFVVSGLAIGSLSFIAHHRRRRFLAAADWPRLRPHFEGAARLLPRVRRAADALDRRVEFKIRPC